MLKALSNEFRILSVQWMQAVARLFSGGWREELQRIRRFAAMRSTIEVLLWASAAVGLGIFLVSYSSALFHQHQQRQRLMQLLAAIGQQRPAAREVGYSATASNMPIDGLLGLMEIPRLGISATYEEGIDDDTLAGAIGHVPGTPLPGEIGNAGLAAHRDTYFRRLGEVQAGDLIVFKTRRGERHYLVQRSSIVQPDDVSVLDNTPDATVTLVTCYPFRYVGSARQRFIVTAKLQE